MLTMIFRLLPIAARNLTRNRKRSLFTMLAVAIGLAMLILLDAVNRGIAATLLDGIVRSQVGEVGIFRKNYRLLAMPGRLLHLSLPYDDEVRDRVRSVRGVRSVSGRIVFQATLSDGFAEVQAVFMAVDPRHEAEVCPYIAKGLRQGTAPLGRSDTYGAIINVDVAKRLFTKGQGPLTVLATNQFGGNNSMELSVHGHSETVFGLRTFYVSLAAAQQLLEMEGRVTELVVAVEGFEDPTTIASQLQTVLGEDFEVLPWTDLIPEVADANQRQESMQRIVAGLLMLLVLFGITNTMLMCVRERTREIGTMASLGMSPAQVALLFVEEGFLIGLVGCGAGVLIGSIVSMILSRYGIPAGSSAPIFVDGIHPIQSWHQASILAASALSASTLAGLVAAWKAARTAPIAALATSY